MRRKKLLALLMIEHGLERGRPEVFPSSIESMAAGQHRWLDQFAYCFSNQQIPDRDDIINHADGDLSTLMDYIETNFHYEINQSLFRDESDTRDLFNAVKSYITKTDMIAERSTTQKGYEIDSSQKPKDESSWSCCSFHTK